MRTLTFAQRLAARGIRVGFAMRHFNGNLMRIVEDAGFRVYALPGTTQGDGRLGASLDEELSGMHNLLDTISNPPAWLVVDHYELDRRWESALRPRVRGVFVIDDLANRLHACDVLLDQNEQDPDRYDGLVPTETHKFLGARYALVRDQFIAARERARTRDGTVTRILVFYGGIDAAGETAKALAGLAEVPGDYVIDAIVPHASPHREAALAQAARDSRVRVHHYVNDMAAIMENADLALGAGGTATWERCFLGLPTISSAIADNQRPVLAALERAGAVVNLGDASCVDIHRIQAAVESLIDDPDAVRELSRRSAAICNGYRGAAEEVLNAVVARLR